LCEKYVIYRFNMCQNNNYLLLMAIPLLGRVMRKVAITCFVITYFILSGCYQDSIKNIEEKAAVSILKEEDLNIGDVKKTIPIVPDKVMPVVPELPPTYERPFMLPREYSSGFIGGVGFGGGGGNHRACGNNRLEVGEGCDDANSGGCTKDCAFPLFESNIGRDLQLSDDSFAEVSLIFNFSLQGDKTYSSAFVNSNGNVTFGSGDTDFSESISEFLSDQPRLGVLWDDINPGQAGSVHYNKIGNRAVFTWLNVPEFFSEGNNTFQLQINNEGKILFSYKGNSLRDALIGITPGDGASDPGPIDFSNDIPLYPSFFSTGPEPTVYEQFLGTANEQFDLEYHVFYFIPHEKDEGWQIQKFLLPFCGDGLQQKTEQCDDGNNIAGDGCSSECIVEFCGDGIIQKGLGEDCDDGNKVDNGNGCTSDCQANNICGNGIVEEAVEGCDDAGSGSCTPDCCFPLFESNIGEELDLFFSDFKQVSFSSFIFPFQGDVPYASAFVNTSGSVSFGQGQANFNESIAEFLAEAPRLSILWGDLIPISGGAVHFNDLGTRAVFTWQDVVKPTAGTNTFQIQINHEGKVLFTYDGISAIDTLVGATPGNGASDPGETDYNNTIPLSPDFFSTGIEPTSYELFTGPMDPFDLDNQSLYFIPHSENDGWDISRFD
jgi:cysteine-rich repeat protein